MWLKCLLTNVWRCGNVRGLTHTEMRDSGAFWRWALRPNRGRGVEVMLAEWGSLVCYYLSVTPSCNVVLLVNLKGVPGVLDGDRVLGKMGSIAE